MMKRSSTIDASDRLRLQAAGPESAERIAGLARRIHGESDDNLLSAEGWCRLLASPAIYAFLLWSRNKEAAREAKAKTGNKREEKSPIGFFILQKSGEDVEILDLGLIPQVRGAGLGNELMSGVETICRAWNAKRILLEVREGNRTARKLYQKRGFLRIGRRHGYYGISKETREDALVMELCLGS